jgi:Family of unknown function (DUF5946)
MRRRRSARVRHRNRERKHVDGDDDGRLPEGLPEPLGNFPVTFVFDPATQTLSGGSGRDATPGHAPARDGLIDVASMLPGARHQPTQSVHPALAQRYTRPVRAGRRRLPSEAVHGGEGDAEDDEGDRHEGSSPRHGGVLNMPADSGTCPGCGLELPELNAPTPADVGASPACWALYGRLLVYQYGQAFPPRLHRLTVDTYAVQHPDARNHRSLASLGPHLIGLCLLLERGASPQRRNELLAQILERPPPCSRLKAPTPKAPGAQIRTSRRLRTAGLMIPRASSRFAFTSTVGTWRLCANNTWRQR